MASASLRVQDPAGCVHVQPLPAIAVAVNPVGTVSATVTVPLVTAVPEFFTVMVYVAPVCPCVKFPVCDLVIVKSGAVETAPLTKESTRAENAGAELVVGL